MRLIGLTGGIASGKSTVSAILRELGAQVLDADQIAREVVEPGKPALHELAARFPGTVSDQGVLDRKALAARVFAAPKEREALNRIIHPRIQETFRSKTEALGDRGVKLVIYDAPLLIENGLQQAMHGVIVVSIPRELQRARMMARDGSSAEEAEARLASQLPLSEKVRFADWVIDNSGSFEQTASQVKKVWDAIKPDD